MKKAARLITATLGGCLLSGFALLPATAATVNPVVARAASQLSQSDIYVAPGYDGPTINPSLITRDIQAGTAQIAVVELPMSALAGDSAAQVHALPELIRQLGNYSGNVAVVFKTGFRATDPSAANNAFNAQKGNGPTAVVDAYIKDVQHDTGSPVAGTVHHHYGRIIAGVIVVLLLLVLVIAFLVYGMRRRSRNERAADQLGAARRNATTSLSQLEAEFSASTSTSQSVQMLIDTSPDRIREATSVSELESIALELRSATHALNPAAAPFPESTANSTVRRDYGDSSASSSAYNPGSYSNGPQQYAVNSRRQVVPYTGDYAPRGYLPLQSDQFGNVYGLGGPNAVLDAIVFNDLYGNNLGSFDQGYDQGVLAAEERDGLNSWNQQPDPFNGGGWPGSPDSSGGGSFPDTSPADTGGGNWGADSSSQPDPTSSSIDFGGGGGDSSFGGGDFGGGGSGDSSGGGNW